VSTSIPAYASLTERLRIYLITEGYSASIQRRYGTQVSHFLNYCDREGVSPEAVHSSHVTQFLRRRYRRYRRRHGASLSFHKWRWQYTGVVHMLLRLAQGKWPVADPPTTARAAFHRGIVQEYDTWLRDLRGLHPETRAKRAKHALWFLSSLGPRADQKSLVDLSIRDIDSYLKQCCSGLRRASIEDYTVCLRDFLRFLFGRRQVGTDLSAMVIGPRVYDLEGIPSALRAEEVLRVLESTREDRSPIGLRDYAVLMLLATYGLRAAEIVSLRLEDIDWRRNIIRVRHSKTGTYSELPLLREPGEAILRYLQQGRSASAHREVFLRTYAPHRPFKDGSILHCITSARLKAASVTPHGRHGPHAFRHARAVSLLRSGVPLKVTGDVLGHKTAEATAIYLKLATQDLRAVGLELPSGVLP
jgi:integrase/recombinase XerD